MRTRNPGTRVSVAVSDTVTSTVMGVMSGFVANAVTVLVWSSVAVFVADFVSSQVRTSVTEVVAKVVTNTVLDFVTDVIKRKVTMPVWRVLSSPIAKAMSKGMTGSVAPRTVGICRDQRCNPRFVSMLSAALCFGPFRSLTRSEAWSCGLPAADRWRNAYCVKRYAWVA